LAVLTAISNAASNILQRIANRQVPMARSMSPRLIWNLLHRKVWLAGFGAVILAFILQAGALRYAQLSAVEPIVVLELPLTVLGASWVFHSRLPAREWSALGTMTAGMALLVASLSPHEGATNATSAGAWALGVGLSAAVMAALVVAARGRRSAARAGLLGAATGIGFGMTAAFTKAVVVGIQHGFAELFSQWETYAMAVTGLVSMMLLQNALQAGRLIAAQPAITLLDPFSSILWGVFAFHERTNTGYWLVAAIAGAGLMIAGAVMLSGSPLLEEQGATEGPRRRGDSNGPPAAETHRSPSKTTATGLPSRLF